MGFSSQWRHNGCDSVSNHQPHDCLRWIPAQMASNAENVFVWWRHQAWNISFLQGRNENIITCLGDSQIWFPVKYVFWGPLWNLQFCRFVTILCTRLGITLKVLSLGNTCHITNVMARHINIIFHFCAWPHYDSYEYIYIYISDFLSTTNIYLYILYILYQFI